MTKADIADSIFEKVGLSKKEAQDIIEIIFDTLKQTFKEGESVKVSGFGTFHVRKKAARRGRNPKTGELVDVQPKRLPYFKVGKELKEMIWKD